MARSIITHSQVRERTSRQPWASSATKRSRRARPHERGHAQREQERGADQERDAVDRDRAAGADRGDEDAGDGGPYEPAEAVGHAAQRVGLLQAVLGHELRDQGAVGRKEERVGGAVDEAHHAEAPDVGVAADQQRRA